MPETTQELARRTPQQELVARVRGDDFKNQIALALPGNVTPTRFVRATVTALMQNPDLTKAEPDSLFSALIRSAQDGLLPDGREAALVMFGSKATYLPMIAGFRKVAGEQGWAIRTQVVYEGDEFDYTLGLSPTLTHKPTRSADRGELVAAYAVATHTDGRKEVEVFTRADIEKVRSVSRAKDSGPWRDWPERMWEKTVGRRLFAKLPLGDRERVTRILDATEVEPAEAAAAIYGPQAAHVFTDGSSQPPDGADSFTGREGSGTGGDQQAAAAATSPPSDETVTSSPAAAAVPGSTDFTGEPGGEPEASPFQPPRSVDESVKAATAAGATVVKGGNNDGLTLKQVAAKGSAGEAWLLWALKSWAKDPFRAQLELYVRAHLPEVWAKYEQHLDAHQQESV